MKLQSKNIAGMVAVVFSFIKYGKKGKMLERLGSVFTNHSLEQSLSYSSDFFFYF